MTPPIPAGIISAPRPRPTIAATLESIKAAGFVQPIVFLNDGTAGCWRDWKTALRQMLQMYREAAWLLICEDDCEFSAGLADYLAWPFSDSMKRAIISPYCADPNHAEGMDNWHAVHPRRFYGSLCHLLSREVAELILANDPRPNWRDGTDTALGAFCIAQQIPYYCHSPSLVKHTGDASSLNRSADLNEHFRQCRQFAGRISVDQGPQSVWDRPRVSVAGPAAGRDVRGENG